MRILTLDLATQTGWCVGTPGGNAPPCLGTIRMPKTGPEIGPFLDFFDHWISRMIEDEAPDVIVFEAPYLPGNRSQVSLHTTRKLQGLASHLELVCFRARVAVYELQHSTVKKALGSGKFDKAQMMAAARRAGMDPQTEDEADAFGIWIAALRKLCPEHQGEWDARLSRGIV